MVENIIEKETSKRYDEMLEEYIEKATCTFYSKVRDELSRDWPLDALLLAEEDAETAEAIAQIIRGKYEDIINLAEGSGLHEPLVLYRLREKALDEGRLIVSNALALRRSQPRDIRADAWTRPT